VVNEKYMTDGAANITMTLGQRGTVPTGYWDSSFWAGIY